MTGVEANLIATDFFNDSETVQAGHVQIENDEIGLPLSCTPQRLDTVACL